MRITFSAPDSRGPRVIPEIPDIAFCHLEGRNGIGKSLAVRLLELSTGSQPYAAHEHSWRTLREQLGDTTIAIDGLPEGAVRIVLTPSAWPERPIRELGEHLGTVERGGQPISWADFRALLRVTRIAGDEGLVQTLASELKERASRVGAFLEATRPALEAWDVFFDGLAQRCGSVLPESLHGLSNESEVARANAIRVERNLGAAKKKLGQLSSQHQVVVAALTRHRHMPTLLSRYASLADELTTAEVKVEELTSELQALTRDVAVDEHKSKEFERLSELLPRRQRALRAAELEQQEALRTLGLPSGTTVEELRAVRDAAAREYREASARRREIDLVGGVKTAITSLQAPLSASPPTLDDQIVAKIPQAVTVEQLRDGLATRLEEVRDWPPDGEIVDLARAADLADRRRNVAATSVDLAAKVSQKARLVEEAEAALARLLGLHSNVKQTFESLNAELRAAQQKRLNAALALDDCRRELAELLNVEPSAPPEAGGAAHSPNVSAEAELTDGASADAASDGSGRLVVATVADWLSIARDCDRAAAADLRSSYVAVADALEVDPLSDRYGAVLSDLMAVEQKLRSELDAAGVRVTSLAAEASDAATRASAASRSLWSARESVRDTHAELLDAQGKWRAIADGLSVLLTMPLPTEPTIDDDVSLARQLLNVATISEALAGAAQEIRNVLASGQGVLDLLAQQLDPRTATSSIGERRLEILPQDYRYDDPVREWAEAELASILSIEALRTELFGGAETVDVDLRRATVGWRFQDGVRHSRPIEAFSSGEQVFLYTRAKLERLRGARSDSRYSMIVLDEFGAFVARNRLGQLLTFVRDTALGPIADQILVILPLAHDYENEQEANFLRSVSRETGDGDDMASRINQVAERRYFAIAAERASR